MVSMSVVDDAVLVDAFPLSSPDVVGERFLFDHGCLSAAELKELFVNRVVESVREISSMDVPLLVNELLFVEPLPDGFSLEFLVDRYLSELGVNVAFWFIEKCSWLGMVRGEELLKSLLWLARADVDALAGEGVGYSHLRSAVAACVHIVPLLLKVGVPDGVGYYYIEEAEVPVAV